MFVNFGENVLLLKNTATHFLAEKKVLKILYKHIKAK